jgi:hypothetical protein
VFEKSRGEAASLEVAGHEQGDEKAAQSGFAKFSYVFRDLGEGHRSSLNRERLRLTQNR